MSNFSFVHLLPAFVGNPLYLLLSLLILMQVGARERVSANVYQYDVGFLMLLLLVIASLRFGFFVLLMRVREADAPLLDIFERFLRNHRPQYLTLGLALLYVTPIEGNVMGLVILPLSLIGGAVVAPWVLYLNIRSIRGLDSGRRNAS